jgi:hypothetical protein
MVVFGVLGNDLTGRNPREPEAKPASRDRCA